MKVVIYVLLTINLVGLIMPLSMKMKSQTDAKVNNKITTSNKSTSEMTFSAANMEGKSESAVVMESVFSARPVNVVSKMTTIGEPDHKNEDTVQFNNLGDMQRNSLRFKQNDFGLKNLEIPRIVPAQIETFSEPPVIHLDLDYTQRVYNYNNIQSIENKLLNSFKDFIEKNVLRDYSNMESVSVTQINLVKENDKQAQQENK